MRDDCLKGQGKKVRRGISLIACLLALWRCWQQLSPVLEAWFSKKDTGNIFQSL